MKFNTKSRICLLEWLKDEGMSVLGFTKKIGGTYQNVWLWVHGKSRPSYTYAHVIQEITHGSVTINGWHELCETAKEPKNAKHQTNTSKNHGRTLKNKRVCKPGKKCA